MHTRSNVTAHKKLTQKSIQTAAVMQLSTSERVTSSFRAFPPNYSRVSLISQLFTRATRQWGERVPCESMCHSDKRLQTATLSIRRQLTSARTRSLPKLYRKPYCIASDRETLMTCSPPPSFISFSKVFPPIFSLILPFVNT